jgi:hypothetical protein
MSSPTRVCTAKSTANPEHRQGRFSRVCSASYAAYVPNNRNDAHDICRTTRAAATSIVRSCAFCRRRSLILVLTRSTRPPQIAKTIVGAKTPRADGMREGLNATKNATTQVSVHRLTFWGSKFVPMVVETVTSIHVDSTTKIPTARPTNPISNANHPATAWVISR